MGKNSYVPLKHIRYEIDDDDGKNVLIIPVVDDVPDMERVLCLVGTSLDIWEMLDKHMSINDIALEISKKYNIEKTRVEKDVLDFIHNLIMENYILFTDGEQEHD